MGSCPANIGAARAPTPIAPAVCAIVFKVRIAERGLSMSFLNPSKDLPSADPLFNSVLTKVGVILNNTASQMEHKNENTIDTSANNKSPIPQRNEVLSFY